MVNPIGRFSRAGDTHTFVLGLLVLVTMAEVAPYVAVSIPLPEAGDGVTATVIISSVLAVFVGLRPISGALPGRGVGYLRGFPTRNRGEVFGLVLLVCCWAIMLGVGILVLSGTTNSSVHSGGMWLAFGLLAVAATLTWVRVWVLAMADNRVWPDPVTPAPTDEPPDSWATV